MLGLNPICTVCMYILGCYKVDAFKVPPLLTDEYFTISHLYEYHCVHLNSVAVASQYWYWDMTPTHYK